MCALEGVILATVHQIVHLETDARKQATPPTGKVEIGNFATGKDIGNSEAPQERSKAPPQLHRK